MNITYNLIHNFTIILSYIYIIIFIYKYFILNNIIIKIQSYVTFTSLKLKLY